MKKYINLAELASRYGVSTTTAQDWLKKDLPYVEKGGAGKSYQFDSKATDKWHEKNIVRKALEKNKKSNLFDEQTRKTSAEADLKELELSERLGNLIEVDVIEKLLEDMVVVARKKLEGMPAKLASALVACNTRAEAKSVIEKEVNENLGELVTFGIARLAKKGGRHNKRGVAKVPAPASANGKPVGGRKPSAPKRKR